MPRPAVPPEKRRRVARACDSCKRRKERCNGDHPCSICVRRGKHAECSFSNTPARLLRNSSLNPVTSTTSASIDDSNSMDSRDHKMAINRLLDNATAHNTLDPVLKDTDTAIRHESSASIPDHSRLLRDPAGKFMYVGDSASLSFLQSVRRIVSSAIGECEFTTDPKRHSILETAPTVPMIPGTNQLDLVFEDVKKLAHQFLLATAGLADIFESSTFFQDLEDWVNNGLRDLDHKSCVFYLVIAIGAQVSLNNGQQELAELYFSRGRQQAFYMFTEAPSLMTVQAYTLITVYMLGACRRNGAFMNFGIAVRATFALGMHHHSTHSLFDDKESLERQSTWRSVRMLDVFFSASLGRPPATCDLTVLKEGGPLQEDHTSDFSSKVLSLAAIYDRIVIDVYMKKAVSTQLASSISEQLRIWTHNMPDSLDLSTFPTYDEDNLTGLIAATHIISAYHWAIILLTRPFLTSQILQDMSRKKNKTCNIASETGDLSSIKTFADACVDSSLRGLEVVGNLLKYASLPKRLPFFVNAVCNIALVLGAAVFADQDKNFPLQEGLEKALEILRHFTPHDPHASRFEQVITYLSNAVEEYISRRNRHSMEHRSREVSQLFGTIGHPNHDTSNHQPTPTTGPTPVESEDTDQESTTPGISGDYDSITPTSFDKAQNDVSDLFTFASSGGHFPDITQPPSSIFGSVQFPGDAYLFMEPEPSIFGLWTG